MKAQNNSRSFVKKLLHPFWHYLYVIIPMFFLSFAGSQTYYYNVEARNPSKIDIGNLDYYLEVFSSKIVLTEAIVFLPILYLPFLVSLLSIKFLDKLNISLSFRGLLKFILSTFGMNLISALYLQIAIGIEQYIDKIIYGTIGLSLLSIAIYLLLKKNWKSGEIESIKQTFLVFTSSTILVTTFLLIIEKSISPSVHKLIYSGLIKDLIFLSIIYVLLNSFSIWNLVRLSVGELFKKRTRIKNQPKITSKKTRYSFAIILCFFIIVLSLLVLNQELAWYSISFKNISRSIYGPLNQSQIDLLWAFHNDHIIFRTAICLIGGVIFTSIIFLFIKIGSHYILYKKPNLLRIDNERSRSII